MKQPFFLLRLILFLLVAASFNIGNAEAFIVDQIYYDIIDGNCLTVTRISTDYLVEHDSVNIPDSVNGMPVTAISNRAFSRWDTPSQVWKGYPEIKSVTIGNAVTTIGKNAFYGCTNLTSVNLGNSVATIGDYAFSGCTNLTSVTIPNSVTSIGKNAFYGCTNLTSVTIPNSVTTIGSGAFNNTAWYNSQPDGVVYAGRVAYKYKGTMPIGTSITLKEETLGITSSAFYGCTGLTSINLGNSVATIGDYAFSGCTNLTSVTIPNSVATIGDYAFYNTAWYNSQPDGVVYAGRVAYKYKGTMPIGTSITLKEGTLGITSRAFYGCTGLTSINLRNSLATIGDYAFSGCTNLTSVIIPNSLATIGDYAFNSCTNLTSVTIPNSVTTIGAKAFDYCRALKSVSIGSSVKKIGDQAFYQCPIEAVYITDLSAWCKIDFSFFDDDGFLNSSGGNPLVHYDYDYYDKEPARLFLNQKEVINLVIPEDIVAIPWGTFMYCQSLRTVDTGPNVKIIYGDAFRYCPNLEEIMIGENVQNCPSLCGHLSESTPDHYYIYTIISVPFPEHVYRLIVKAKSCESLGNPSTPYNWGSGSSFDEIVIDEGVEVMPDDIYSSSPKALYYNAINGATQPAGDNLPYWHYGKGTPQHLFIGNKVESIAGLMFDFVEHADTVTCYATVPPAIITECFNRDGYENSVLEVPEGTLNAYANAEGWKEFLHIVEIGNGSTAIPGDVDGDGVVGISDVTTLIKYLLSGSTSSENEANADCDGDGKITIADVTTLINYLLSGKW